MVFLSLFGVALVLLSVVAAVGFFGFIGTPSTLITFQILPFLVKLQVHSLLFYLTSVLREGEDQSSESLSFYQPRSGMVIRWLTDNSI